MDRKKCSSKKHSNIVAISYCKVCKIYLCNKCQNLHSELFENHHSFNIDKNINEIFTGFCEKENHNIKFQYYCKNHNILCCAACICKIKDQGNGEHKDCTVLTIKEIKDEKKNILKENINFLKDLPNTLEKSINDLQIMLNKINEKKEELKIEIQKIFTKIRNELNNREDELLLEIDQKFNDKYFNEDIIKEGEKLPNKIKASLEKGINLDREWNDEDLNNIIYDCIEIENNVNNIKKINENIKMSKLNEKIIIDFNIPNEDNINNILEKIKKFGKLELFQSNIIKNDEDIKMISDWIKPNSNISYKLLFKVSRDGDRISTFTEKVSGKSPTLIIIQSKSGNKFGGYTSVEWKMTGSYSYKNDKYAFIFSIDKKKKFKLKNESCAICGDKNHFAFGGGHDLTIWDKCTTNDNSKDYRYNNSYEMPEPFELTGGNSSFKVQECEVYEVKFS